MAVGNPTTAQTMNARLGRSAVQMRKTMEDARDLFTNATNLGTEGLVAAGFTTQDAATFLTMVDYLNALVGCYYGTVQQGGTDGTGAILFDFDNALSTLWGAS